MSKRYVIVELRSPAREAQYKETIQGLHNQVEALQREVNRLSMLYGSEVQYNSALVDLLRLNGIPFRPLFDHSKRHPMG